jgi:hypothetical protein
MNFPKPIEYKPEFQKYIDLTHRKIGFFEQFKKNTIETIDFFKSISKDKLNYKYAENKWSVKDILMHIIDTERGFSYRAIVCLRQDNMTPLYGMDEDFYAKNVDVANRSIESLIHEFHIVRQSFIILFENCTEDQSQFLGNGIGHQISARALGFVAIGHCIHHTNVIQERYLKF